MGSKFHKSADVFPIKFEMVDGHMRRVRTVTCDKCGYPARLMENSVSSFPVEVIAKKFTQRGWSLGGMNVCPRCQAGKKPMAPAARRAAFCAIAGVERAKPTLEEIPMPAASPAAPLPRVATPEERRRIREALDTHYDEDAGRYRSSFSDKSLAAKLDVPSKWVKDIREACGYGPDTSEATAQRTAEIETVKLEFAKLQADLLERFDELERRINRLTNTDA